MEYDFDNTNKIENSNEFVSTSLVHNNETTISKSVNKIPNRVSSEIADKTTINETSTSSKHISAIWKHFILLTDKQKAKYKHCNSLFSHKKGCGTSYLWHHLGVCLKFQNLSNGQIQLKFNSPKKGPYTNDLAQKDISNIIVWDELSFQFVEDIMKAYDKRKTLIKEIFQNAKGKISLTCDAWTSLQQLGYLSLQTITLDNATSNDVAIRKLANCISQDSFININEDLFYNCCFAYILNLIVKDRLRKILDIIGKVRNCVKTIYTAPRRHQIFLDICESESVKYIIPPLNYTLKVSASLYLTLNSTLASIWNIRTHLLNMKSHSDSFVHNVSQAMIGNFNKYWEHNNILYMTASRQTQITEKDLLCEVKWYLAIARDFLAIPATSIISEQMFSCAGCIIDNSCASLNANMIAVLMCQRNWLDTAKKFG
ncbi:6393_t:CDS:2 [Dentiscutata erythropus]|uniref:6393_t:CDS:1 n=1 Tax=Dentiscutata erythropus TaxID=1348616 RepID=A0A9N9IAZ9_9GLOM|nr:6393_t:CDS:2 [Dentiscutata erythropus]